jgi:alkaline phosphatase D
MVNESADFIAEVVIAKLIPATAYVYRVTIGDSQAEGRFKTAPAPDTAAALSFTFASCIGGQGYCRPAEGWTIFDTMSAQTPDFFIITGDTVYSTNACPIDRNVEGAEAPANSLAEFRTRYRYQLGDTLYSNFLANTPVYVTWDDHEIADNFAGPQMSALNPARYAAGRQAFFEYWPVQENLDDEQYRLYRDFSYGANAQFFMLDTRSYRDPIVNWDTNPTNRAPKTMLGAAQNAWLREGLTSSDSTWKFIISSVPLGYPTGFPQPQVDGRDGWADNGEPSGYETELMSLLYFIEANDIENVIFLSGDAHWPYALSFDPDRDGTPNFYELSASPLSAIPLAPGAVDQTFNPKVLYAEGTFQGDLFNFGQINITDDGALIFKIIDRDGTTRYELALQPD